ncbi:hypothetical protein D0862_06198 [Hortaea werneckii]|uniref:Uncharacterized protein n=1 Tax=Hortaea werneckii TaxID=91943 RepID=A0A3M7GL92_HORWE|nr:hypothetical protein D0862_06198 [Hortaea werneckii]
MLCLCELIKDARSRSYKLARSPLHLHSSLQAQLLVFDYKGTGHTWSLAYCCSLRFGISPFGIGGLYLSFRKCHQRTFIGVAQAKAARVMITLLNFQWRFGSLACRRSRTWCLRSKWSYTAVI